MTCSHQFQVVAQTRFEIRGLPQREGLHKDRRRMISAKVIKVNYLQKFALTRLVPIT
jgi:hypothetical protein